MKHPRILAAALVLGTASFGTIAAINAQTSPPEMPGQIDTSRVAAGMYATDPAHTLVEWEVSHFGFNPYYACSAM